MATENNEKKKRPRFITLTGIGLQMGITIYLFSYLGKYLDREPFLKFNHWLIVLTLIGVVVSFYNLLRQVNKINDNEKHD